MSHIFVDGGGHDHGGHGHGGGGTYGNSFIVADGSFLHHDKDEVADYVKQINPKRRDVLVKGLEKHGNNFLAHLMGVESDKLQTSLLRGQRPKTPHAHVPTWMLALGSIKPSTFFHGMQMKQSMWFFVLFASLFCWLFVEYWIRHHEPFANSVIGTSMPHTRTTAFDRAMMQHCVGATPIRTSNSPQSLYVPLPGGTNTAAIEDKSAPRVPVAGAAVTMPVSSLNAVPQHASLSGSQIAPASFGLPIADGNSTALRSTSTDSSSFTSAFMSSSRGAQNNTGVFTATPLPAPAQPAFGAPVTSGASPFAAMSQAGPAPASASFGSGNLGSGNLGITTPPTAYGVYTPPPPGMSSSVKPVTSTAAITRPNPTVANPGAVHVSLSDNSRVKISVNR